jgi:hypothetical protein
MRRTCRGRNALAAPAASLFLTFFVGVVYVGRTEQLVSGCFEGSGDAAYRGCQTLRLTSGAR